MKRIEKIKFKKSCWINTMTHTTKKGKKKKCKCGIKGYCSMKPQKQKQALYENQVKNLAKARRVKKMLNK